MIESLETRKLYSATLNDEGVLEIVGTSGDDVIRVMPAINLRSTANGASGVFGVGQIIVRHIWATGLPSKPRPSFGCLKLRPMMSSKSSSSTWTLGSKE